MTRLAYQNNGINKTKQKLFKRKLADINLKYFFFPEGKKESLLKEGFKFKHSSGKQAQN